MVDALLILATVFAVIEAYAVWHYVVPWMDRRWRWFREGRLPWERP